MPDVVDGVQQTPLAGVSMRYSFDDADVPYPKETQYYEMLSTVACGTTAGRCRPNTAP